MIEGLLVLVTLVCLAAIFFILIYPRPRKQLQSPTSVNTRYPVVLLHGLMGFDRIGTAGMGQGYFRGIAESFQAQGITLYCPRLPAVCSVPERAECLAKYIRGLSAQRVNLIAHSMGGLDARYAIAKQDLGGQVASLITIGTPHRGTILANVKDHVIAKMMRNLTNRLSTMFEALDWLTEDAMTEFNRAIPNPSRLLYASVVAQCSTTTDVNPLLRPTHAYLQRHRGPNDGIVTLESQRWGEVLLEIEADHYAQIGWTTGNFDAIELFASLMRTMASRGL